MRFITQGKTNWKFLLIVAVLGVIVGGGTLICQNRWLFEEKIPFFSAVKKPKEKPKEFTILSPAKGETWIIGETYQVKWAPTNTEEMVEVILRDIRIPSASLSKVWQIENISNTGNYSLTVPEVSPGGSYLIYVSSKERFGYSSPFSIEK